MIFETLAQQGNVTCSSSMAAGIASKIYDVRKKIIKDSLLSAQQEEHRIEFVASIHGIDFINDSKASNVNATWYAMEKMNRPVVWIAGGQNNGSDYSPLFKLIEKKVKGIICLGVNNEHLFSNFSRFGKMMVEVRTAKEAVDMAYRMADMGDAVLLSPACPSFDLFESYEDKGVQFKSAVNEL